jgi:hypothetical protein
VDLEDLEVLSNRGYANPKGLGKLLRTANLTVEQGIDAAPAPPEANSAEGLRRNGPGRGVIP